MTKHLNPLKDSAYEAYIDEELSKLVDIDFNDTAADVKDESLEIKAINRKMTEKWRPILGRKAKSFLLAELFSDITDVFSAVAWYASSQVFSPYAYTSFRKSTSLLNPLADNTKLIFRDSEAGIFRRRMPLTNITITYSPNDPGDTLISKIMNLFCPGFKLGSEWKTDEDGKRVVPVIGATKHTVTLKDIMAVVGRPIDDGSARNDKQPDIDFKNLRYWGPRVKFTFETSATMGGWKYETAGLAKPSHSSPILININPILDVDFDAEGMAWCLSSTDVKDITIYDVVRHLESFEHLAFTDKGANQCRERTSSIGSAMNTVGRINRNIGAAKPRVNSDGFGISPNGKVGYYGFEPRLQDFFTALNESYDKESGVFRLVSTAANIPIILDWSAGVFIWSNANLGNANNTTIRDISEVRPILDADIGAFIRRPLLDNTLFAAGLTEAFSIAKHLGIEIPYFNVYDPFGQWKDIANTFTAENLHTKITVHPDTDAEIPRATALLQGIGKMFREVAERYDEHNTSLAFKVDRKFAIFLYGKYANSDNAKTYLSASDARTRKHVEKIPEEKALAAPVLYNMPGLSHLMPHQQEVVNIEAEKNPTNTLMGVSAGGGKTASYSSIVMNNLARNIIRRPLIVMPKPLLRQFQNEVMNFYSQGAIRVFPVYLSNWKRWTSMGLNFKDIETIIESQPKNTIFVTDYNFLKYRPEEIGLGIHKFASYPMARWLSKMFDMVVGDESHKVKNAGPTPSAVSRAYGAMVASVNKQILASGTVFHNIGLDMLGQVSKMAPTVFFGDMDDYTDGKLLKSSKLSDLSKAITSQISCHNVSDKRWSFLLPKINEAQHSVAMTPNQQIFYNEKINQLVREIGESEEFKAAKKRDDEEGNTNQQEFLLNRALVGFEVFMGAPDFTERSSAGVDPFGAEFTRLKTTTPKDLISPKVAEIDEIINAHFTGGKVGEGDEAIQYVKSNAKIIIFAYNVAIPAHIYKHSKYRDIMLHYTADGERGLEIIEEFKNNPKFKVLVAGEKTLAEGHNLQCFTGDRHVLLPNGESVSFYDLFEDESITHVMSYDYEAKKILPKKILNRWKNTNGNNTWYDITFTDNLTGEKSQLRVTGEHGIYLKGGAKIKAKDLKRGDQLVTWGGEVTPLRYVEEADKYMTKEEFAAFAKSNGAKTQWADPAHREKMREEGYKLCANNSKYWADPELREKMVSKLVESLATPEARALKKLRSKENWDKLSDREYKERLKNMSTARSNTPNKPEQNVIDLGIDNLEYTGCGTFWKYIPFAGIPQGKNPDFIVRGPSGDARKVVEIIGHREFTKRDRKYDKKLISAYAKAGIDCMIIDAEDCYKIPDLAATKAKLESFVNNHEMTVTWVKKVPVTDPVYSEDPYCYDLEVEGTNKYFVLGQESQSGRDRIFANHRNPILVSNCASRVVRVQPGWTPGDFDQTLRRVLRPDVPDENGNLKYNRQSIDLDWVICAPSFEVAKTCRLMVKFLDRTKGQELDSNPRFNAFLRENPYDELSLFTMNLESITESQTFESLAPYQQMYARLRDFEDREYDIEKVAIWKRTILRLGLAEKSSIDAISKMEQYKQIAELEKILPSDQLRAKALVKIEHETLPGYSAADRADFTRGYTPLVSGTAIVDPYKLGLIPVASVITNEDTEEDIDDDDRDDEDEDENIEVNVQVEEGDYVVTEFGIGIAGRQRLARGGEGFSPNLPVTLDGIGRINIPSSIVFVPETEEQKRRLKSIYLTLKKSKRPTSVLTIDDDALTINDITVPSSSIAAGKPSIKTLAPERAQEKAIERLQTPMQPKMIVKPAPTNTVVKTPAPVLKTPAGSRPGPVTTLSTKPIAAKPPVVPPTSAKPGLMQTPPKAPVVPLKVPEKPKPAAGQKTGYNPGQIKMMTQPFEAVTISNQLAVVADANNEMFDSYMESKGFARLGESVIAQIVNLKGLENIFKYLDKNFYIPDNYLDTMEEAVGLLQKGKSSLSKLKPNLAKQREFLIRNSRQKVSDPRNEVHPIIITEDDVVYILLPIERARAASRLRGKMVVQGVGKFSPNDAKYIKFYNSRNELLRDLDSIEYEPSEGKMTGVIFKNEDDLAEQIQRL